MKILTLFQPATYGGMAPVSHGVAMTSFEAEDFQVEIASATVQIRFVGGNTSGHDYAGAVLFPGVFPFLIREKARR